MIMPTKLDIGEEHYDDVRRFMENLKNDAGNSGFSNYSEKDTFQCRKSGSVKMVVGKMSYKAISDEQECLVSAYLIPGEKSGNINFFADSQTSLTEATNAIRKETRMRDVESKLACTVISI